MTKQEVLIIEDDRDTARYYQHLMELLGYEVEIALSAKAALARLAGITPGLILLDLRLGSEIGGEDILYQIRSNPRLDKTRVIVVTAYPVLTQMISNLADLVLIKPVELDELKDLIRRVSSPEYTTKRLSFRDPVTQLFNREFFYARLEHAYERIRRRPDFLYAVIVLALFPADPAMPDVEAEHWNDILREVAERLRKALRPTDTITRLSGWKFAILLEEIKSEADLSAVIERLEPRLTAPYPSKGREFAFQVSFASVAYFPHITGPRAVLDIAERALEEANSP